MPKKRSSGFNSEYISRKARGAAMGIIMDAGYHGEVCANQAEESIGEIPKLSSCKTSRNVARHIHQGRSH